jgi:hypothetical protein
MAVKPLDFVTWEKADSWMSEQAPWRWDASWDARRRALANALKSGPVEYRCDGDPVYPVSLRIWMEREQRVSLGEVIAGLDHLTFGVGEVLATYEVTEVVTTTFGSGLLRTSQSEKRQQTRQAMIRNPELVFSQLRDYLIRYEGLAPQRGGVRRNPGQQRAAGGPSGKSVRKGPKPTTPRELADWLFERHEPRVRNTFKARYKQARDDASLNGVTRRKMGTAYRAVYNTVGNAPPKEWLAIAPRLSKAVGRSSANKSPRKVTNFFAVVTLGS